MIFGLFAHDIRKRLPPDDLVQYDEYINLHANSFGPKGPQETWLAQKVAESMFRLDQLNTLHLVAVSQTLDGETPAPQSTELPNLSLYGGRIRSDYEHFLGRLEARQEKRAEKEAKEMHKADTIAQACAITQTKFQPGKIGFDFSLRELLREFLKRKVLMNAYQVLQEQNPTDDTKFAFQERYKKLAALYETA